MEIPAQTSPVSPDEAVRQLREQVPEGGLFSGMEWLVTPEPFFIEPHLAEELEKLGYRLHLFVRACNLLYQQSAKGKQPAWIADYLDRGKPPELVALSREKSLRDDYAKVIRPDVILTPDGFTIAELDTVPGGIGLTAWLNETYSRLGFEVIGGADGMLKGFASILPQGGKIAVSEESATYRPEMEWLASRITKSRLSQGSLEVTTAGDTIPSEGEIYRFFELFDLPNIAASPNLLDAVQSGRARVTPPFKPYLEEKLWFALFWMGPLREFWRRELRENHFHALQKVIPRTWILDPTPLPHHAVIPGLEIQNWDELGNFSQKQREFVLKISGFSELGWGSRGVTMASDVPQEEWRGAVRRALESFQHHPYILQQFHKGRLVAQPYSDAITGEMHVMNGRVRLCPYYFVADGRATLQGALATICPSDKKLLHGMRDAILAPAAVRSPKNPA